MSHVTFPRILYSATEPTGRIFQDQAALDAAGAGWVDSPDKVQAAAPPPAEEDAPDEPQTPRSRR